MDLADVATIGMLILIFILLLIFISLPLYLTARWLDEDKGFGRAVGTTVLLVASVMLCLIFIPYAWVDLIVAIIINLVIIKYVYDTEWGKAFAMWIVTIVVAVLLLILVGFLGGLALLALS